MATGIATVNLGSTLTLSRRRGSLKGSFMRHLLAFEAWLDARASRQALYAMDDRALADIGLSRADVHGVNEDASLKVGHLLLIPDASQERV